MLSRVLLLLGLSVGVCWSTLPRDITDVSDYSLPDEFFPENDRDVVLPQRRFLSPTTPSSRSSAFLKKVTRGKDSLQKLYAKQMHNDQTDKIEVYILKLAHMFSQISSSASDTVVSLQKPTRRFFLKSLLNLPSVACDASEMMIQKLLPNDMSPVRIKTQFILNPDGDGGNTTAGGNATTDGTKTDAGKTPADSGSKATTKAPPSGAKPTTKPAKKPRTSWRLFYRRAPRSHGKKIKQNPKASFKFLNKIEGKFKSTSGAILKKIGNTLSRYGHSKRELTNADKKTFNGAFMAIAELSKDALGRIMTLPSRRFGLGYFNSLLSKAISSCRSKADLISSIVPTNFEFNSKVQL